MIRFIVALARRQRAGRWLAGLLVLWLLGATPAARAAITAVASSVGTLSSSTTSTVQIAPPAGLASGDLMIALVAQRGNGFPVVRAAPAGWTLVLTKDDGSSIGVAVYSRFATAAEPTTYTWQLDVSDRAVGAISAFRGVDTAAPVNASGAQSNSTSTTYTAPSVSTTTAGTVLVALYSAVNGNGSINATTGMTQDYSAASGAGPNGLVIGASYATQAAAGPTGNKLSTGNTSLANLGVLIALNASAVSTSIDHYELSLASSGIACMASTVSVTACTNASSPCTSKATTLSGQTVALAVSAGTLAATTISFDATGVASTTLSHAGAGSGSTATVTLSGEQSLAANARQCCPNGSSCAAASSCAIRYSTAGFIVAASAGGASATLPTQTAGTASGGYWLRAVQTNTTTKACEAALTGSTSVNWAYQCNNPTSCAGGNRLSLTGNGATTIAGNPSSGVSSTTAVAMTFDANGNAPFSFSYSDVGQITLAASRAAGGSLLTALNGSSNAFVVRPAGFTLSGIRCASYAAGACATTALVNPGNNPGAASASGTAFMPAGMPFAATVTAVDSLGNATPNYGHETSPEGVKLTATLVLPAGGNAPALGNASAFGNFSGGSATGTSFAWSEVGIITLQASVTDGSYLGTGDVTGTASGNVGRFIPHHFDVALTPACGSFSYAGQPFTATVMARNAYNDTTLNYDGSSATSPHFAKMVTLGEATTLGLGSLSANSIAAGAFSAGVASGAPVYSFSSKTTAPQNLVLRATDPDATSSAGHAEGTMALRSGRLRLSNAFGKAGAALQLPVVAEHWSGNAWVLNSADSCTTLPAASVALSHQRSSAGGSTAASTSASAITLAVGSGLLTLAAPSPAGSGLSLDIGINLGSTAADQSCLTSHPATTGAAKPWLRAQNGACAATADRDPAARASFGIFSPETRKTVHVREIF